MINGQRSWQDILHGHWRTEMAERLDVLRTQAHPAVLATIEADLATCTPGDVVWQAIDRYIANRIGVEPRFYDGDPPKAQLLATYQHALLWEIIEQCMRDQETL